MFQERFFEGCDARRIDLVKMAPYTGIDYGHLFSDLHGNYQDDATKLATKTEVIVPNIKPGNMARVWLLGTRKSAWETKLTLT